MTDERQTIYGYPIEVSEITPAHQRLYADWRDLMTVIWSVRVALRNDDHDRALALLDEALSSRVINE